MIISSDDNAIDYIASNDPSQYVGAVGFKIATAIAGDIFNVSNPSADAEELFFDVCLLSCFQGHNSSNAISKKNMPPWAPSKT